MSKPSKHTIQSLIRQWLIGKEENRAHQLLKQEAETDSFLQNAMDGFQQQKGNHSASLSRLDQRLKDRIGKSKKRRGVVYFRQIAAAAAILILGILGINYLLPNADKNTTEIAQTEAAKSQDNPLSKAQPTKEASIAEIKPDKESSILADVPRLKKEKQKSVSKKEKKKNRIIPSPKPQVIPEIEPKPKTEVASSPTQPTEYILDGVPIESSTSEPQEADFAIMEGPKDDDEELAIQDEFATAEFETIEEAASIELKEESIPMTDVAVVASAPAPARSVFREEEDIVDMIPLQGIIMDENGEVLIGASILEVNTNNGTMADFDGKFEFTPISSDNAILISYVGYQDMVFQVDETIPDTIILQNDGEILQEVIIASSRKKETSKIFSFPDTKMETYPKDGYKKYQKYIDQSLVYPSYAIDNGIEGTVIVEFKVYEDGKPQEIEVKESLGFGCDEEAIRLLKEGPNWESKKAGKRTKFAFKFKLKKEKKKK